MTSDNNARQYRWKKPYIKKSLETLSGEWWFLVFWEDQAGIDYDAFTNYEAAKRFYINRLNAWVLYG